MRTQRLATGPSKCPSRSAGFTILEILIVVAIILIMSAVAAPSISRTIRNYTIRGAADGVATEIQTARMRAIKKNVNFGTVFVVLSDRTYQYYLEDTQPAGGRSNYPDVVPENMGPIRTLPIGVLFDPNPAGATQDDGFRFNRLGAMCDPDDATSPLACPDLAPLGVPVPGPNYVGFDTAAGVPVAQRGAVIGLTQPDTGLSRRVVVNFGGRIQVQDR